MNKTILVADDNDESRYFLEALFRARGYAVVVARDGAEALNAAQSSPPSLVVTDILMPNMDGFSLCRAWRSDSRLARIPFLFYTATYTDPRDREFALSIGADEFLVKPTEPDDLLEVVNILLQKQEADVLPDRSDFAPANDVYLRKYNAALVRKLEDKLVQLEAANQKLATTEAFIRAVLNNSPLPIVATDSKGRILLTNPAFATTFGYSAEEALGRSCSELIPTVGDDPEDALLTNQPELHTVQPVQSRRGRKDGTVIDVEVYTTPMKLGSDVTGFLAIYRDVTEWRKLEAELAHSQKMEAMGRLAGGVAHDFNNLLTVISGHLELLSDSSLSSKQQKSCDEATAAARRAASLTRQLLAFSRKHRETPVVTDLNTVLSNMTGMLNSLVSRHVQLDLRLSDTRIPIFVDVSHVEMVVMNLAINAQDAMPDGGTLTLSTRRAEQNSGAYAVLTVSDTGRGMAPEVKSRVFEPFFTTKQPGKGTGLGLSTVHEIVQRWAGHVEVESELGRGSRFLVYFPEARGESTPKSSNSAPASPPAGGKETILLAEDEVGIREMAKAYLEGLGYRVLEASNGSDAVKVSDDYEGAINLIVTDITMPLLSGNAAVAAIRERRTNIKVLFISGYAEDSISNIGDVLSKPFEFSELGRRVRSALDSECGT